MKPSAAVPPSPVTIPRLGWSMEEGTFVEWLKRDGDPVRQGEPLFALESDKATENIEALDAGILHIAPKGPKAGEVVKVGQIVGYLLAAGATAPQLEQGIPAPSRVQIREGEAPAEPVFLARREPRPPESGQYPAPPAGGGKMASPRARRVARELGIEWNNLHGSGRNGRVRERDIREAASNSVQGRLIPHTSIRRHIAQRMVAGVTQAAPVTLTTRADATNMVRWRDQRKATADKDSLPSYTDIIVQCTATVLRRHPLLQAQWRADGLFVPDHVHIALAVDTEGGLLAPVLLDVDRLTVQEIAQQSRAPIASARAGRLTGAQMRGATFTVTNLGMFGIDAFTPIIHLPQCAVLGVGRIVREPAIVDDRIVPRDLITLSLTFDHRVVDGAPAARFLNDVRQEIERGPV